MIRGYFLLKIQDKLGLDPKGNYGFANLCVSSGDTVLFLDFNFIRTMDNPCFNNARANNKILDFFSRCFNLYKMGYKAQAIDNFRRVSENNELHLGHSVQSNPHGSSPSPEILDRVFAKMLEIDDGTKFHGPMPMILFADRFGPDYLSDLIANIIFKELSDFTSRTVEELGVTVTYGPNEKKSYWNDQTHQWEQISVPTILVDGSPWIFVPTQALTKKYAFSADNYVYTIIMTAVKRKKDAETVGGKAPNKHVLLKNILDTSYTGKGKKKEFAFDATRKHPQFLMQYYNRFGRFLNYNTKHLKDDNDLEAV